MGLVLIQSFGPSSNGVIISMIRSVGAGPHIGVSKSPVKMFFSSNPHLIPTLR